MSIICRPAGPEDIPKAIAIRSLASYEVREKYGYGATRKEEVFTPDSFYAFSMEHELEGFWVAEEDDTIVGMMITWVRDAFRFLSYLFVAPEYQGRKVGRHLLDKAIQNGAPAEITNCALITYAYNAASIGLYMKYNMFPREPVYKMAGAGSSVYTRNTGTMMAGPLRLENNPGAFRALSTIDRKVLGFSRERHHEYFLQRRDASAYLFRKGKSVLGYAYIWDDGQVGPLAASSGDAFTDIIKASLILAADKNTEQVSILVPGSNASAIAMALQNNLRVREPYILMATKPFGRWNQYLFHSPPLL
jgi:ribosomal protein S18 acetylase RimI-like enzyme